MGRHRSLSLGLSPLIVELSAVEALPSPIAHHCFMALSVALIGLMSAPALMGITITSENGCQCAMSQSALSGSRFPNGRGKLIENLC